MFRQLSLFPALAAPLLCDVSVFEYTLAPHGNVRIIDEAGVLPDRFPSELQGIELLPIDFVGRTTWSLLNPERPRLRDSVEAPRLRLPAGGGALYAFRRLLPEPDVFGFFLIDSKGEPQVLLEATGIGATGDESPFLAKIGCAAGGAALLIGTRTEAGGDLYEIDLQNLTVELRTANLAPLELAINGLALLDGFGLALTTQKLLRFERSPGAQAAVVSLGGGLATRARLPFSSSLETRLGRPAWLGPDLVTSADGSTAAFCAGASETSSYVWIVRRDGAPSRVSQQAQHLSGAGFLPERQIGPTLALSPDGTGVAWRAEDSVSAEIFVDRASPQPAPMQLTGDDNFDDTLNDSGVITFASADELVMLVGETDSQDPLQIEGADLYRVNVADLAAPVLTNLSMTSGDVFAPFLEKGTLDTESGLVETSPGRALTLAEDDMGSGLLLELELSSGQITTLLDQVKSWSLTAGNGTDLFFGVRRETGPIDQELYWRPSGGIPELVFGSTGTGFFDWSQRASSFAGVAVDDAGYERLGRIDLVTGDSLSMPPTVALGPTLDHTATGSIAYSMEGPSSSFYLLWNPDSSITPLLAGAGKGFFLARN